MSRMSRKNDVKEIEQINEICRKYVNQVKTDVHDNYLNIHTKLQLEEIEFMKQLDKTFHELQKKIGDVVATSRNPIKSMKNISSVINICENSGDKKPSSITSKEEKENDIVSSRRTSLESAVECKISSGHQNMMFRRSSLPYIDSSIKSSLIISPSTSEPIKVKMVKFVSLAEMYVVPVENYKHWKKLTNKYKMIARNQPITSTVKINEIYLVKYNNEWYRGLIESSEGKNEYCCNLIDMGQSLTVKANDIREIPDGFNTEKSCLIKCALFDIEGFEDINDAEIILDCLLMEQEAMMFIYQEKEDTKFVDFIPMQEPCSVCETLVKFESAKCLKSQTTEAIKKTKCLIKKNLAALRKNLNEFSCGVPQSAHFTPKILHVVSPSEIYLADDLHWSNIMALEEEMARFYANALFKITVPWINRCCAVYWESSYRRGKIIEELNDGKYLVQLVDYGIKITVKYDIIKDLHSSFYVQETGALHCSLKGVLPVPDEIMCDMWSKKACHLLKTLLSLKSGRYEVIIDKEEDNKYEITLNRFEGGLTGGVLKCVNKELVRNQVAISCDSIRQFEGVKNVEEVEEEEEVSAPSQVKMIAPVEYQKEARPLHRHSRFGNYCIVSYITNPTEFYITLEKEVTQFMELHDTIQKVMSQSSAENPIKRGPQAIPNLDKGLCLVQATIGPTFYEFWYRGKILAGKKDRYKVFLRDKGNTLFVTVDKIAEIPHDIVRYSNAAVKCKLACIKPVCKNGVWTQTAIELFTTLVGQYKRLCLRFYGTTDVDDTIPVILHGMKIHINDPLGPDKYFWTQVNEELVLNGVAHRVGNYIEPPCDTSHDEDTNETPANLLKELEINEKSVIEVQGNVNVDTDLKEIDQWIPAPEIQKTVYSCTPTNVDFYANIYIQDNANRAKITYMNMIINKAVKELGEGNFKPLPKDIKNKPCLVKFPTDSLYYRGIVVDRNTDGTYDVQFADYGNVCESIDAKDICLDVVAHNLPLFVNKVRLIEILPKNNVWDMNLLDMLHVLIVDKVCNICIEDSEVYGGQNLLEKDVVWCRLSIYESNIDVAKYLLDKGLVIHSSIYFNQPIKTVVDEENKLLVENFDMNLGDSSDFPTEEEIEHGNGLNLSRFDHLSEESFNPQETSSRFDVTEQRKLPLQIMAPEEIKAFPPFDLKNLPSKFFATVLKIIGQKTLNIQPNLNSTRNFSALERALFAVTSSGNKKNLKNIKSKVPCIALFEPPNKYGRAIVDEIDETTKLANVYFVDYLTTKTLSFDMLFECPIKLQKLSVHWITAELTNVSVNKNTRNKDLAQKLSKILAESFIYCVVNRVNTVDPNDPIGVELYVDDTCTELAYESLIQEKYYFKRD